MDIVKFHGRPGSNYLLNWKIGEFFPVLVNHITILKDSKLSH